MISTHCRQRKRVFFSDDDHDLKILVDVLIHYGDRVSLDGVAARGLMSGRGPSLAMGGTKSELFPTKPRQIYPIIQKVVSNCAYHLYEIF